MQRHQSFDDASTTPMRNAWPVDLTPLGLQDKHLPRRARASPGEQAAPGIRKVPTGITGLDEITLGGLPFGRTTLITGGPGCGKTLLGMEFLVQGARQFNEPGAFIAFEETAQSRCSNRRW
jgi:circadian clock protein KaiC